MFGWLKKHKAYKLGQDAGNAIASDIDARIQSSIIPRCQKGLEVFIDRLATVWESPPGQRKMAALAELEIYQEHSDRFLSDVRAEINIGTYKWDEVIEGAGIRELIDTLISTRLSSLATEYKNVAKTLCDEVISEIDRRQPESEQ